MKYNILDDDFKTNIKTPQEAFSMAYANQIKDITKDLTSASLISLLSETPKGDTGLWQQHGCQIRTSSERIFQGKKGRIF